jgi:prefoldin subunit 5
MYDRKNQNQTQVEAWISMANKQTIELEDRKSEIQRAIDDIKNLRIDAEKELEVLLKKSN